MGQLVRLQLPDCGIWAVLFLLTAICPSASWVANSTTWDTLNSSRHSSRLGSQYLVVGAGWAAQGSWAGYHCWTAVFGHSCRC